MSWMDKWYEDDHRVLKKKWLAEHPGPYELPLPAIPEEWIQEVIRWAKAECGIDWTDYIQTMAREGETPSFIVQDIQFQIARVKNGI
jgi:hypothetical protein